MRQAEIGKRGEIGIKIVRGGVVGERGNIVAYLIAKCNLWFCIQTLATENILPIRLSEPWGGRDGKVFH